MLLPRTRCEVPAGARQRGVRRPTRPRRLGARTAGTLAPCTAGSRSAGCGRLIGTARPRARRGLCPFARALPLASLWPSTCAPARRVIRQCVRGWPAASAVHCPPAGHNLHATRPAVDPCHWREGTPAAARLSAPRSPAGPRPGPGSGPGLRLRPGRSPNPSPSPDPDRPGRADRIPDPSSLQDWHVAARAWRAHKPPARLQTSPRLSAWLLYGPPQLPPRPAMLHRLPTLCASRLAASDGRPACPACCAQTRPCRSIWTAASFAAQTHKGKRGCPDLPLSARRAWMRFGRQALPTLSTP